ncbi:MAG TPA: TolC family protein [Gemmatimonadaceae bacterium]|nr:TolC family protein [Gemmatimonadaceae bacterium]
MQNNHSYRRGMCLPAAITVAIASLLAILAPHRAIAQRARAEAPPLVLGTLYDASRRDSPRVSAARSLARAARARIAPAKLPPDPQLQLGLMNYTVPGLRPMDPLGMTQLQLMQMVPVAGKLGLAGRVASAQASAEAERSNDMEWEVRADVAMAFYDLYRADRELAVSRETLRLLQEIRGTAESMYRVGEGRQADVLRSQVEIARMVEDTIRTTTMRTAMVARLDALLDRRSATSPGEAMLPRFPDAVPPLDSLLALADSARPMVRAALREVDAASARARLARREIWPDLTLGVQYGQRAGEMGTERMGSLMVGAAIPVFAGRRQLRMREEEAAMREMAVADLAAMRADTRARLTESYADLARARTLAALYRTTVIPQAEATVSSALAAYRVGGVDFMTLLDDRMTVNRYRQELSALDAEQGKAWAELEMLTGRQLFDPNAIANPAAAAEAARGDR